MIRLLDIPGAEQLDARLELLPHLSAHSDGRTRELLRSIVEVMGFSLDWSGWIEMPDLASGEEPIDMDMYFEISDDSKTAVDFWRERGWDITGPDGSAVHFYADVLSAMIMITEGRAGHSKMTLEAELWKRRRANDAAAPNRREKKQDQSFLLLGRRGRPKRAS